MQLKENEIAILKELTQQGYRFPKGRTSHILNKLEKTGLVTSELLLRKRNFETGISEFRRGYKLTQQGFDKVFPTNEV